MSDDLITELRHHETEYQELVHGPLCGRAAHEIERLRATIEDAVETLEAMDLHTDNPLYDRLRAAIETKST